MIGGGLSKRGSDQVKEAGHQLLIKRMQKSNYWMRKIRTKKEGTGLYRSVVHTNTYNM